MTIYDSNSISLMNKKSQVGWNHPVSTTFEPSDAIASWAPGKRSGTSRRDTLHPAFPSECPGHHRHNDLETGFARMSKRNGDVGKFRDVNIQHSIHKITWYNMIYHCKYRFLLTSKLAFALWRGAPSLCLSGALSCMWQIILPQILCSTPSVPIVLAGYNASQNNSEYGFV